MSSSRVVDDGVWMLLRAILSIRKIQIDAVSGFLNTCSDIQTLAARRSIHRHLALPHFLAHSCGHGDYPASANFPQIVASVVMLLVALLLKTHQLML